MRSAHFLLLGILLPAVASPGDSTPSSPALQAVQVRTIEGHNRYLQFELIVPAPHREVWKALTDSEALATWAGPAAHVDLRRDGAWDVYFKPDAPKGERGSENRLLAVIPQRMLIIEAGAPPQFPTVKQEKTLAVFELEAVDEQRTRVRMTQTGWKDGEEWDAAFAYLADANREWLSWLYERFSAGPKEWPQPGGNSSQP